MRCCPICNQQRNTCATTKNNNSSNNSDNNTSTMPHESPLLLPSRPTPQKPSPATSSNSTPSSRIWTPLSSWLKLTDDIPLVKPSSTNVFKWQLTVFCVAMRLLVNLAVWFAVPSLLSCYVLVSNEQVISPSKSVTSERNVSRLLDDLDSQVLPPPRSVMTHPPAFPLAFYKLHFIFILYFITSTAKSQQWTITSRCPSQIQASLMASQHNNDLQPLPRATLTTSWRPCPSLK